MNEQKHPQPPVEGISNAVPHQAGHQEGAAHLPSGLEKKIEALREQVGDVTEALIDLEEWANNNKGCAPPKARLYRIRIDRQKYDVACPTMKGAEILKLAGKTPADRWRLQQKFHGGQARTVRAEDVVDFTAPGVEKFMTLPLDQTDGQTDGGF